MEPVIPGLYASAPDTLPFDGSLEIRSFLVQRDAGNLLVYRGDAIEHDAGSVTSLGGVSRQYLNHRHEASPSSDWVSWKYGSTLFVHRADADSVSRTAELGALFYERHRLDGDFEVIPTPGHTPGATAYLWDSGTHRCLFTGDTIFLRGGEWVAAVLDFSDRDRYLESLELLRGLDFDVLVPWVATADDAYYAEVDSDEAKRRIGAIMDRVRHGAKH
jgi:Metallo-beta-lactamase superfamily